MGKAAGKKRRRAKKFQYNVNRKKLNRKFKKMPVIECAAIKKAWTGSKGVAINMNEMGLSADPNRTLRIPSTMEMLDNVKLLKGSDEGILMSDSREKISQGHVVESLEKEANRPLPYSISISNDIYLFVKFMVEKYGDDYEAMARDPKNHYQLTPRRIEKRIEEYGASRLLCAMRTVDKIEKKKTKITKK